jgi:hypothetical protein
LVTMLINPYTPSSTFKNFTTLDKDIGEYYDRVYHSIMDYDEISPRYFYETGLKIAFRDAFYYIDLLYDDNPQTVIDVGCGECVWKKWFPNIIGFDPRINEFSLQDFVDDFDEDFSKRHTKLYDCGLAFNSLHFILWDDIVKQIDLAMNIVNDKFLFTFNLDAMKTSPSVNISAKIKMFKKILESTAYNLIMFDSPLHRGLNDIQLKRTQVFNGTVRFILQHPKV